MATMILPLLVAVIGVLIYALASNDKVSQIGKIAYAVGLFWVVYHAARQVIHFP